MFPEIQFLRDNLETESRGDAIKRLRQKISSLLEASDWKNAEDFFQEFHETFKGSGSNLGIVKDDFRNLVGKLLTLIPDVEAVVRLNRLQDFSWFDALDDADLKKGYIAEHLATFSQGGGEIFELQKARSFYRKAQRPKDVSRIQGILSERVRSFNLWTPIVPPRELVASIQEGAKKYLDTWLGQDDETRLSLLILDHFGVRSTVSETENIGKDLFSSGFLQDLGGIQTVGVSSDGRTNSGEMAKPFERDNFSSWDYCHRLFSGVFSDEVKKWLARKDGELQVCGKVSATLRQHLSWDENSTEHFNEGLAGWMHGFPQVALSFWLPYFESVLRHRMADLGEDIISPRERAGIEDFVMFENLLSKALNHYDETTVRYWRWAFSTENGLGWNLRNNFCHGLLPIQVMRADVYPLAVLLAYLFLLQPVSSIQSE